ncbi:UPF0280 family protein [Desulfococcaceae bacterium HSG9]|nr:UPF0280 family protein [Desulfococcaceae bacterium HSG9]
MTADNKALAYKKRSYRQKVHRHGLISFNIVVQETDLLIHTRQNLSTLAKESVLKYRGYIEAYIKKYPAFAKTLTPWPLNEPCAPIIRSMTDAGTSAGVGPMAAVAGAIAEYTGRDLLDNSDEVIVENGGDLFLKTNTPADVAVFAGSSPLSMRLAIRVDSGLTPVSVCTSSGTVGHSFSRGRADCVCVVSPSGTIADASATAIGNYAHSKADIQKAIGFGKTIDNVLGLIVIVEDGIGFWGDLDIIPL